jgi:hypothetical protein
VTSSASKSLSIAFEEIAADKIVGVAPEDLPGAELDGTDAGADESESD